MNGKFMIGLVRIVKLHCEHFSLSYFLSVYYKQVQYVILRKNNNKNIMYNVYIKNKAKSLLTDCPYISLDL